MPEISGIIEPETGGVLTRVASWLCQVQGQSNIYGIVHRYLSSTTSGSTYIDWRNVSGTPALLSDIVPGITAWGVITGTLSAQLDLQAALDAKLSTNTTTAGVNDSANRRYVTDAQLTVIQNTSGTNTGDQSLAALCVKTANLSDLTNAATARTNLGLGTAATTAATAYAPAPTLVATLAADAATGANVTPISLTGLVFNYAANSVYRIWFMGRVSPAAATTGCGFQFDLSSAVTSIDVVFDHQLANTGTTSGGHSIADDASVGVSSGLPGTSTYPVRGDGLLRTGANAGTAQLRFRSETTAVITAKAGLTLVVEKVA